MSQLEVPDAIGNRCLGYQGIVNLVGVTVNISSAHNGTGGGISSPDNGNLTGLPCRSFKGDDCLIHPVYRIADDKVVGAGYRGGDCRTGRIVNA